MAVKYLELAGVTEASIQFRSKIKDFDDCVVRMNTETDKIIQNWIGKGSTQFQTQMSLMQSQLEDISEVLYDIYEALIDAEKAYIDQDIEVKKQYEAAFKKAESSPGSSKGGSSAGGGRSTGGGGGRF